MNIRSLAMALRNKATELSNVIAELGEIDVTTPQQDQTLRDAAELIRVLARLVEGKPIDKAFGAPGDWGYETPVGAALHEPADIPELGAPVDQTTLIEQYRITCEAQQRAIERMRDRVAALEKPQPLFWYRPRSDGCDEGPIPDSHIEKVRRESGAWVPLIARPIQATEAGNSIQGEQQ